MTEDVSDWALEPIDGNPAGMFIQWKGTDLCMDFHCPCGTHSHFDGFFAHFVECGGCGQVWQLKTSVPVRPVDRDAAYLTPLKPDQEDE